MYVSFSNSVGQTVFFQYTFVFVTYVPFSGVNRILSVNFHAHDVRIIQQQCGQIVFFQCTFANGMCVRIQQQYGINRFCSVNICELDACTIPHYTGACSGSPQ